MELLLYTTQSLILSKNSRSQVQLSSTLLEVNEVLGSWNLYLKKKKDAGMGFAAAKPTLCPSGLQLCCILGRPCMFSAWLLRHSFSISMVAIIKIMQTDANKNIRLVRGLIGKSVMAGVEPLQPIRDGKNHLLKVILWLPHVCSLSLSLPLSTPHIHAHTINTCNKNKYI